MKAALIRIDQRLIHGQVVGLWFKEHGFDRILAIDDTLAKDPFMQRVYASAAPARTKVQIVSVEDAVKCFKQGDYDNGTYMVLFRDVETTHRAWQEGFPIDRLQIGNLEGQTGAKFIHRNSRLTENHLPLLTEMLEGEVDVYVQSVPLDKPVKLKNLLTSVTEQKG